MNASHIPRLPNRRDDSQPVVAILLANLLPLVGVVWLNWAPATLVFVYGLEVLLTLVLAAGKALFAQRPPPANPDGVLSVSEAPLSDKRGSVQPVDWLPPVSLRNVPFTLGVSTVVAMYVIFFTAVVAITAQSAAELLRPDVALSVLALLGGQLAETKRQYFDRRQYEDVSPYAVIETPARQLLLVLFALAFLGLALGTTAVLVLIVGVKLLVEWSAIRAAREDVGTNRFVDRFAEWIVGQAAAEGGNESAADHRDDPVHVPAAEPEARIRPDRTALVFEGVLLACWYVVSYLPFVAVGWFFVLLVVVSVLDSVLLFWIGAIAFVVLLAAIGAIRFVRYVLAHGTLEYQRREDVLVAYDRLVAQGQWSARLDDLRDVAIVNDRFADRVLGTRTIRVTTGWGSRERERHLGPVEDADRFVEAFALPLSSTDHRPIDRVLAVGSVGSLVVIVLGATAVVVGPGVALDTRVDALWVFSFALLVPWWLWKRACPDPE